MVLSQTSQQLSVHNKKDGMTDRGIYRFTVTLLREKARTQIETEIIHFLKEEIEVGEW